MQELKIRTYDGSDLESIIQFYTKFNFFFDRDKEFFSHLVNYPGVALDSIYLAIKEETICGLIVLSILETKKLKECKILEFVTNEDFVAQLLLDKVEAYCKNKNVDIIIISAEKPFEVSLLSRGWIYHNFGALMVKPLHFSDVLDDRFFFNLISKYLSGKDLILVLDNEILKISRDSLVSYPKSKTKIFPNGVIVELSSLIFMEMLTSRTNPFIAYLQRKIKIQNTNDKYKALSILNKFKFKTSFSCSMAEEF